MLPQDWPLPSYFKAGRALVRLKVLAELAVIPRAEAEIVGEAERCCSSCIRAVAAFADTLHRDGLKARNADNDRAEALVEIVDELAIGREVEDLPIQNEVTPDLRANQRPRP